MMIEVLKQARPIDGDRIEVRDDQGRDLFTIPLRTLIDQEVRCA